MTGRRAAKGSTISVAVDHARLAGAIAEYLFELIEQRFGGQLGRVEVPPLLLTVAAICERTGLGQTFVKNEIRAGRLRARKAGDRPIVTAEDFDRWVASLRTIVPAATEDQQSVRLGLGGGP
jgi:hypothetical protein